jgi:hypothetical protein
MTRPASFREDPIYLGLERDSRNKLKARDKAQAEWIYGKEPWTLERLKASRSKYVTASKSYDASVRRLLLRRQRLIDLWGLWRA